MDKKLLLSKITESKRVVEEAEEHLTKVLADTARGVRAEKTTIAGTLQEAMAKLRVARLDLEELAAIVTDGDPPPKKKRT